MIRGRKLVLALVACSLLCGCSEQQDVGQSPSVKPPVQPPHFSSSTEALAKARKTYEAYLTASQKVSEHGGDGVVELAPWVSPEELAAERASAENLKEKRLRTTGETSLKEFKLQRADLRAGTVIAYACVDLEQVRVLTDTGRDVTPKGRPNRQTSLPHFEWRGDRLVLVKDESWAGESIC